MSTTIRCAGALVGTLFAMPLAAAEGETGPMLGGAILATHGVEDAEVAGIGVEMVAWHGRLGVAAEASRQWSIEGVGGPRAATLGASARVLAFRSVVPSVLDAREVVELGIELQAIAERTWWDGVPREHDREPLSYGFGLAIRLRGVGDDPRSRLLAESRLFVRALVTRSAGRDGALARDVMPTAEPQGVGVIIGLGALFGSGAPDYVTTLRRSTALDSEWMVP